MKKILYSLFFVFCSFIGFNYVFAASNTLTLDYSSSYTKQRFLRQEQLQEADKLKKYIESTPYYDDYDFYITISNNNGQTNLDTNNDGYLDYGYPTAFFSKKQSSNYVMSARVVLSNGFNMRFYSGSIVSNGIYSTRIYPTAYNNTSNGFYGMNLQLVKQYAEDDLSLPITTSSLYFFGRSSSISNSTSDFTFPSDTTYNMVMLYYSSMNIYSGRLSTETNTQNSYGNLITKNDDTGFSTDEPFGGRLYSYLDTMSPIVEVQKVITYDSNTFGYFNNYVTISNTLLSPLISSSIECEKDRPFTNNYCDFFQSDFNTSLLDYQKLNTIFSFSTLFGEQTGVLSSNQYYLYAFRLQKPFVPKVLNFVINSTTYPNGQEYHINDIWHYDNGSYIDYVISFDTNNITIGNNERINSITVLFQSLADTGITNIAEFNSFSAFRSSKIGIFTAPPTRTEADDFISDNNLNDISSISSNDSYFTDTTFETFGFGGLITAPFRILYALEQYDTCEDVVLPFPNSNKNFNLKCVRANVPQSVSPLVIALQVILSGIIIYRIALSTLRIIKELLDPLKSNIEVIDL